MGWCKPLLARIAQAPGMTGESQDTIIAVVELLVYVALAVKRGAAWAGLLIFYVGDNDNARGWLRSRRARNPAARHLLRILARAEAEYHFQTLAGLFI